MPPPTPPGVPENVDPETLEPLPVERLLHGLSAQLIGDLTSAAEQDQSLKQPFLEQLVPALSVGDFPEKELLTSSSCCRSFPPARGLGLTPQRRFPNFDQLCRDRFLWRSRLKNIALDWKAQ